MPTHSPAKLGELLIFACSSESVYVFLVFTENNEEAVYKKKKKMDAIDLLIVYSLALIY